MINCTFNQDGLYLSFNQLGIEVAKTNDQLSIPEIKESHGGKRAGAGRPKGTKRKEATKPVRVPVSLLPEVEELIEKHKAKN